MDKKYISPEIEIIKFLKEDIITTSENNTDGDTGEDTETKLPSVNPFG